MRHALIRFGFWACGLRGHDWDEDTYHDEGAPMRVCRRCGQA